MLTHLKLDNFKIWRSTGPKRLKVIPKSVLDGALLTERVAPAAGAAT